jgi:hypothetical protein
MGGFCVTYPQYPPRRGRIRDDRSGLGSSDAWSSGSEFQNFGLGGDVEHDSAPVTIEGRRDVQNDHIGARANHAHRQTAKRTVGMRSVFIHAPEHGLRRLIGGKRTFRLSLYRRSLRLCFYESSSFANEIIANKTMCGAASVHAVEKRGNSMRDYMSEDLRELSADELENVSGGAQYPPEYPDGLPQPVPHV